MISLEYAALIWVLFTIIDDLFSRVIIKLPNWIQLLWCLYCITFWVTLLVTFNPFIAAIASYINYIVGNLIPTKLG